MLRVPSTGTHGTITRGSVKAMRREFIPLIADYYHIHITYKPVGTSRYITKSRYGRKSGTIEMA